MVPHAIDSSILEEKHLHNGRLSGDRVFCGVKFSDGRIHLECKDSSNMAFDRKVCKYFMMPCLSLYILCPF